MSLDSSPSVKERAAAIERRVSLEAENESRRLSGESNQNSYGSTTTSYLQKRKTKNVEQLSFQPLRPTRIFSKDIEERALLPRRLAPGSIKKHSYNAADSNINQLQSINEIRESIKIMKQRIDSTISADTKQSDDRSTSSTAFVTPRRQYTKDLGNSDISGIRYHYTDTDDKTNFKRSHEPPTLTQIEQDISRISVQSSSQANVSNYHPISTANDHEQDRLAILYAQYLQAMYKATLGAKEMERQQAAAMARLEYSQTLLANRQDELNISESKIRVATEIDILDKLISNQTDYLMQVATRLSRFKSPIELYMEKMDKSTFIVPPNESMWEYLETLKETVQECGAALEELAIIRSDDKQVTRLLTANQSTCTALKQEIDLLCSCKQITS
ncbi:hypothetical protein BGW37DRAFT_508469 [Umbelopsis sp. PMI_123]|nr:hypothetical protein BGW37DRAFT_508469 [Umbelopsis sp. PMI_123]